MNDIIAVIAEMRARRVNHGKSDSPTLQAWADRIEAALAAAKPVAYQYREDLAEDGIKNAEWNSLCSADYETLKALMGGHGPARLAGNVSWGDARLDEDGWETELRVLYDVPQQDLCRQMWERTMNMAAPAMDYVQRNADKFGALPGDDRLEIICREFLRAQMYTSEMGEAAGRYHATFKTAQPLPAQWLWSEVWDAMRAAGATGKQQDGCTESNCSRCLTHPDHRGDMPHAGIGSTGKQQVGEVQGDALATLSASWRACAEKHDENAREADSIGDMTATVQYLETKSEVLRQVAEELEAALAARQPVGELHLPPDGFYKIVFDDAEVPDESFARSGALNAALRRFEQISNKWNAHLFVRFANNTRDCTVPNATPAQGIPGNVLTHRNAWRKALVAARDAAEVSPPDVDDRAYWDHEIQAFDRTFDRLGELVCQSDVSPGAQTFQAGVSEWMGKCFLPSLYSNMTERGDRLLEEVLELLQAHGYDQGRVATLVDYVFGRPVGDPAQEVGGVMVTLAGYCWVAGLEMHAAGVAELQRIKQPEVMEKIRRKQEAKNALHFDTPLPGDAAANAEEWPREGDLVRYGDGSSALAIRLGPHAGGWHGYQCCGGYTFFTKAHRPSRADMDTWLDCAKYRGERTKAADSRVAHQICLIDQRDAAPGA